MRRKLTVLLLIVLTQYSPLLAAQSAEFDELRRNIDILAGVLEEGLGIDESSSLFGVNLRQVNGIYLQNQGVVVEVRSPLAGRRNRLSLDSLVFTIQSLQSRDSAQVAAAPQFGANPFRTRPMVSPGNGTAAQSVSALAERLRAVDYSAEISASIRQAALTLRSLQAMGDTDEVQLQGLRADTERLQESLQKEQQELIELERYLSRPDPTVGSQDALSSLGIEERLASIQSAMSRLQEAALGTAAKIQELHDSARERQVLRWDSEVVSLERELYQLLCDYGASLRELPETEFLTVILKGLGEQGDDGQMPDKIHIISKPDLLRCLSGTIDAAALASTSVRYSY